MLILGDLENLWFQKSEMVYNGLSIITFPHLTELDCDHKKENEDFLILAEVIVGKLISKLIF